MRIEFTTKDKMHCLVDSFLGRTHSYVDKGTSERVSVNVGVSRSQPRWAVAAAFRAFYQVLEKHGYNRDTIIQRFLERDGEWVNIVMLAQKGGRAADIGTFHFAFDGLRAFVSKYGAGSAHRDRLGARGAPDDEDGHVKARQCGKRRWM